MGMIRRGGQGGVGRFPAISANEFEYPAITEGGEGRGNSGCISIVDTGFSAIVPRPDAIER